MNFRWHREAIFTKPETLDKFHAVLRSLLDMEGDLMGYANAFAITGNETLALKLERHTQRLNEAHELLSQAIGETIGAMVEDTGRANHNMIMATLAVASKDKEWLKLVETEKGAD